MKVQRINYLEMSLMWMWKKLNMAIKIIFFCRFLIFSIFYNCFGFFWDFHQLFLFWSKFSKGIFSWEWIRSSINLLFWFFLSKSYKGIPQVAHWLKKKFFWSARKRKKTFVFLSAQSYSNMTDHIHPHTHSWKDESKHSDLLNKGN